MKSRVTAADYRRSERARASRERGKALGNYVSELARVMFKRRKVSVSTPSKRG